MWTNSCGYALEDAVEALEAGVEAGHLILVLRQEGFQRRIERDRPVDLGVRACAIGADPDQFFHVGIGRKRLARRAYELALVRRMAAGHGPADRLQDLSLIHISEPTRLL